MFCLKLAYFSSGKLFVSVLVLGFCYNWHVSVSCTVLELFFSLQVEEIQAKADSAEEASESHLQKLKEKEREIQTLVNQLDLPREESCIVIRRNGVSFTHHEVFAVYCSLLETCSRRRSEETSRKQFRSGT